MVNLGTVAVADLGSQRPVTGVDRADGVVHLRPERRVPNGARTY
ncbi:hypothetical protein [Halomarina pelagica]|nr:hypothetical protein [Halomarina sp. BND7]